MHPNNKIFNFSLQNIFGVILQLLQLNCIKELKKTFLLYMFYHVTIKATAIGTVAARAVKVT